MNEPTPTPPAAPKEIEMEATKESKPMTAKRMMMCERAAAAVDHPQCSDRIGCVRAAACDAIRDLLLEVRRLRADSAATAAMREVVEAAMKAYSKWSNAEFIAQSNGSTFAVGRTHLNEVSSGMCELLAALKALSAARATREDEKKGKEPDDAK